jgi:hypothetical protein
MRDDGKAWLNRICFSKIRVDPHNARAVEKQVFHRLAHAELNAALDLRPREIALVRDRTRYHHHLAGVTDPARSRCIFCMAEVRHTKEQSLSSRSNLESMFIVEVLSATRDRLPAIPSPRVLPAAFSAVQAPFILSEPSCRASVGHRKAGTASTVRAKFSKCSSGHRSLRARMSLSALRSVFAYSGIAFVPFIAKVCDAVGAPVSGWPPPTNI